MVEPVDQVVEPAAGEELLAVGRPCQPGEGPRQGDPADYPAAAAVDRDDLVLAVSGVEDRQDRLARVHRDLDREIAQLGLASGRLERPAVGQEDGAVAGHARPDDTAFAHSGCRARSVLIDLNGCMLGRAFTLGRRLLCSGLLRIGRPHPQYTGQHQLNRPDKPCHESSPSVVFASRPLSGLPGHFNSVTAWVNSGHPRGQSSPRLQNPGAVIGNRRVPRTARHSGMPRSVRHSPGRFRMPPADSREARWPPPRLPQVQHAVSVQFAPD